MGSTLLSVCLSAGITSLWYEMDSNVTRGDILFVAILIPMICAPLCTYFGMKSRLKMEALALENERIANTDALTGLSNRRAFFDKIQALFETPQEPAGRVTYFVCDIDHFKPFNAQHGHASGDAVLNNRTDRSDASIFADRLVDRVAREPLIVDGHRLAVTLSVGVFVGDELTPPVQALKAADEAMYAAKANGRNQYVWAA